VHLVAVDLAVVAEIRRAPAVAAVLAAWVAAVLVAAAVAGADRRDETGLVSKATISLPVAPQ
jgi:hypothetical protein